MIDINARINSLDFQLPGETVSFKNQVIFFQSKSILDVVRIPISIGKYDSIFVGVLILVFSILLVDAINAAVVPVFRDQLLVVR